MNNPTSSTTPQHGPGDYFLAASGHLGKRDSMQALSICVVGLDEYPTDARLMCLAAQTCIALNRPEEARLYAENAVKAGVGVSLAHEVSGDVLLLRGMPGEAVKCYRQAQQLDAARTGLQVKIDRARTAMNKNRPVGGKRRQQLAFPEEIARAGRLERDGEPAKAEHIYRDILRRDPDHVEAIRLLAAIAMEHRKYSDAEVFLQRAVEIAPEYARLWLDLCAAQLGLENLDGAITSASRLVELSPDIADSHIALGNALARADRAKEAAEVYRSALEASTGHAGAFSGLAQQLKIIGKQDEAIAVHRENLQCNPDNAEPYWSLANMKTYKFSDHEVGSMESLLFRDDLDDLSIVQLCNALGFAFEQRRNYDTAFSYFKRGNDRRRESEVYDPVETEVLTERLIEVFTKEFFVGLEGRGNADSSPIFIVGLPRSGSTLLEQILASHSQVEGTHELSDLSQVVRSIRGFSPAKDRFPDNLQGLKDEVWANLGEKYLQRTKKYRGDRPIFIDKNPNNFIYAGMLKVILPNAKIINARRAPMDSCFGTYKQLFASGQPFSYDLMEVGEYYLQYQKLMEHWHAVMPGDILDVSYENVVADLPTQVARLLDYCGLPFEQACVDFHQTERSVKTASSEQVRQPIYTSSLELWRNYDKHLDELAEVLAPILPGAGA
jgi:tetratricopeptide (TPR) repeat protein